MKMMGRMLWGSLRRQRARMLIAGLAMLLGAGLVSALANLSFDVGSQAGRELRAYGANIVLLPGGDAPGATIGLAGLGAVGDEYSISVHDLAPLATVEGVVSYVPYLYAVADVRGQQAVVAGTDFDGVRSSSPWWKVEGQWPAGADEALVGASLAKALDVEMGSRLTIRSGGTIREVAVVGVVETGGPEEQQVFVMLPLAQSLAGRPGQVGLVQVSAQTGRRALSDIAGDIQKVLPAAKVRTLRQFADAEEAVLRKVRLLVGLVAALVLVVAGLTVGSTMITSVLERRTEIGLMKALGATEWQVVGFFLAESLSVSALGSVGGYVVGLGGAALIGREVFRAELAPTPWALPLTLAVAVGVGLIASLWPVRSALAVDPSVTLRGD